MAEESIKNPCDSIDDTRQSKLSVRVLICIYFCVIVSAFNAELLTYPLDLVKTRLEMQGERHSTTKLSKKLNMREILNHILRTKGIWGLYSGFAAIMITHVFYSSTRVVLYRKLKEKKLNEHEGDNKLSFWELAFCSMIAGGVAQLISSPGDMIKVQLQMEGDRQHLGLPPKVRGFTDAFIKAWTSGRFRALWIGAVPNIERSAVLSIRDLGAYELSKRTVEQQTSIRNKALLHILSSICAGYCAAVVSNPMDVIRSRMMNQPVDKKGKGLWFTGPMDCLKKSIMNEGIWVMYKGFIPTWIRLTTWSLIFWCSYDQLRCKLCHDNE